MTTSGGDQQHLSHGQHGHYGEGRNVEMPFMDAERRGDIPMISSDCEGIHPLTYLTIYPCFHSIH